MSESKSDALTNLAKLQQKLGIPPGTRTPTNSFGDCDAAITPARFKYIMQCEVYWSNHIRVYVIVDRNNKVVIITTDFRRAKTLLGFLDTDLIPNTVYA